MGLKIEEVYMLLGEKDVIIFQLGEAFNRVSAEKAALEKELEALKNVKLVQPPPDDSVRRFPSGVQGPGRRLGDDVSEPADESASGVGAVQPNE
jgi:hypothetical protein